MPRPRKLLAFAASVGKVGFVYLVDGELMDWGLSKKASASVERAVKQVTAWLTYYRPDLVVIEHINGGGRKGSHTKSIVQGIDGAAKDCEIDVVVLMRASRHPNKYAEARELAMEFPQIEPWVPAQRKPWETEPRNIIYFEALSLAVAWLAQQEPNVEDLAAG